MKFGTNVNRNCVHIMIMTPVLFIHTYTVLIEYINKNIPFF